MYTMEKKHVSEVLATNNEMRVIKEKGVVDLTYVIMKMVKGITKTKKTGKKKVSKVLLLFMCIEHAAINGVGKLNPLPWLHIHISTSRRIN